MFNFNFPLQICNVRRAEVVQAADKAFNFYSELHVSKQNARKQALITKFIRPHAPNVTPESPVP